MPSILPVKWTEITERETAHKFQINKNYKTGKIIVSKDDELIVESSGLTNVFDLLISKIRLTIAEFAEGIAFLHAGVVGWKNRAIIIPGKSFAGKTTLVAEFAKNGCDYFSDEYALIDTKGLVHPFPKKLSMRGIIDDYQQVDLDVEKFGGKTTRKPYPVGWLLIAEYKKTKKSKLKLKEVSLGEGVMASISNPIPFRSGKIRNSSLKF